VEVLARATVPIGAIATVHLGGRISPLVKLREIADAHGCMLIEDACHAPGARYVKDGVRCAIGGCSDSDFAVLSFHAVKHIAAGEGGAVCTNDDAAAKRMRRLRTHGMIRTPQDFETPPEANAPWYYEMQELGWNYRSTDIQCALGRSQLRRLNDGIAERRRLVARYEQLLGNIRHLRLPEPPAQPEEHAYHLYAVAIDFEAIGKSRGQVMSELAAKGIGTQVHYVPLYRQPYYRRAGHTSLPGTEAYYAQTLSIPLYLGLDNNDLDVIATAIRDVLA
jgi:dTDP-4-amino-4,6-dideoxygalactose transaminase